MDRNLFEDLHKKNNNFCMCADFVSELLYGLGKQLGTHFWHAMKLLSFLQYSIPSLHNFFLNFLVFKELIKEELFIEDFRGGF